MQERLSMRKIKEVLRLKYDCSLSHERIAASCGIAQSTVTKYLQRFEETGLPWPLPDDLTEEALDAKLFRASPIPTPREGPLKTLPDFAHVHEELRTHRRLNLTLAQLWQEYREQEPNGYQYTQFCEYYRRWRRTLDPVMRQIHKGGEKLFIDYGDGLFLIDSSTNEKALTYLWVGTWGASNFTYAEATLSQALPAWTMSHVHAFDYFQCVPHILVPDNLRSGVKHACYYEPDINPTYADLAGHYGCAVLPTRPVHPRDKAKVEAAVLLAKRWILSVLRHRTFYSLDEMNRAIRELLDKFNARLLRKLKKSRRELFEALDRPNAKALPKDPYVFAEWKKATVNIDYHIEIDKHYYSVPFRYVRQGVDVRLTAATLEVFLKGERIAAHGRSYVPYGYTTLKEHMPPAHQKHLEWSPSRLIQWAKTIGLATAQLVEKIMADKPHPEQGYRACLGLMRLAKHYSNERVEAAARRALHYNTCSFRSLESILTRGLDRLSLPANGPVPIPLRHDNIRGREYYQNN
jgi:transposase